MAKYKLQKSNNVVNCEILNESDGQYVVRFGNGVIQSVPKYRVYQLDRIDEGVLSDLRDSARRYGRKIASKMKDSIKKIKEFFVNIFVVDNFVFIGDQTGRIIPAIHPINAMEAAKSVNSVNYIPSSDTIEMCNELGIDPEAVENFEFADTEYEGAIQFDGFVSESAKGTTSLIKAIYEGDGDYLPKAEKINLHGVFQDWSKDEIINAIGSEYMARYKGLKPKGLPLMIWGAPGIGKTEIIRSLREVVAKETGKEITIISINGGSVGPDDFTMPATIVKTLHTNDIEDIDNDDFKGATKTSIKDLPKSWLPVYNPNPKDEDADPELLNAVANGGGLIKDKNGNDIIENGPGGIFFIDEYSRMTQAGMDALMQTPTTREIGSNSTLRFGDRWVIVCAANRKSDMSRRGGSEALNFEAASKTRFEHCNFVPDPKDWIAWANKKSERRKGRTNVLRDIVSYIESELRRDPKDFGDFYEMWSIPSGELKGEKGSACPRTWEGLSETLIDRCLETPFGKKYASISAMPKKELEKIASGIVGGDVAKRFASFVSQYSVFTPQDAENVWTKGDNAKYEIIKQQKLNSSNIEEFYKEHIFPLLKDSYPGGLQDGVSPEAALNFLKFLEMSCWNNGQFDLNRFRTICTMFSFDFNVDLRSLTGPYADAANYKEDVVAKNEVV